MKTANLYKTTIIIDEIGGYNPDLKVQKNIKTTMLVVAETEDSAKNKLFGRVMLEHDPELARQSFTVKKEAILVNDNIVY